MGSPLSWGAKGDASYATGSINSGSGSLTVSGATLSSLDVGKVIGIVGAGAAGVAYVGTITAVSSSTTCTVSPSASTTVSGASVLYGTDDTTAVQAAFNNLRCVFFPSDYSFLTGPIYVSRQGQTAWAKGFKASTWNGVAYHGGNLVLKPGGNTNPLLWFQECFYPRIEGLALNGSREFQPSSGGYATLLVRNGAYGNLSGLRVVNGKPHGFVLENWSSTPGGFSGMADEVNITDCWFLSHDSYGVVEQAGGTSIQSPGDQTWTNCHINFNGYGGFYKAFGSFTKLMGCEILTNEGYGVEWLNNVGLKMTGCSIRYNKKSGLYCTGTTASSLGRGHTVTGNHFHLNSRGSTSPRYPNAWFSGCDQLTLQGNQCTDVAFSPLASYGIELTNCTKVRMVNNNCDPSDLVTGSFYMTGSSNVEGLLNIGTDMNGVLA
jgi:hypothetical protein